MPHFPSLQYINNLSEKINLTNVLSRAQGIYDQLFEVKDRLPNEVAVFLGFSLPPAPSAGSPGVSTFLDARHRSSVDEEGLLEACNFSLESTMPIPPVNSPVMGCLEVGEDVANSTDVQSTDSSADPL